jgi:hypothetical protein
MKYSALIISILLIGISCTRNVDLQEVFEEKIVIEGNISKDSLAIVRISQTVNSTEPDEFPMVQNATVVLTNAMGMEETLEETDTGIYQSETLNGKAGKSYQLSVIAKGEASTATATIPFKNIDLLGLSLRDTVISLNIDLTVYSLDVDFQKNGVDSLYCLFYVYRNNVRSANPVFYKNENPTIQNINLHLMDYTSLITGDILKVEVEQMEKWQYEYLLNVQQNNNTETISGLLIGPPDNLVGNISGDALGYFGATTKDFIAFIVP